MNFFSENLSKHKLTISKLAMFILATPAFFSSVLELRVSYSTNMKLEVQSWLFEKV